MLFIIQSYKMLSVSGKHPLIHWHGELCNFRWNLFVCGVITSSDVKPLKYKFLKAFSPYLIKDSGRQTMRNTSALCWCEHKLGDPVQLLQVFTLKIQCTGESEQDMLEEMGLLYEEGRWGYGRIYMQSILPPTSAYHSFRSVHLSGASARVLWGTSCIFTTMRCLGALKNQAHQRCSGGRCWTSVEGVPRGSWGPWAPWMGPCAL